MRMLIWLGCSQSWTNYGDNYSLKISIIFGLFFKWSESVYPHPLQWWMKIRTAMLTAEMIIQWAWLLSCKPWWWNCMWLIYLMFLCWAFALENESKPKHHCRLHSCQGYYTQRGNSWSFKACMLGTRDGQPSLLLVKTIWRGGKRHTLCNRDGKAYLCVILFTSILWVC